MGAFRRSIDEDLQKEMWRACRHIGGLSRGTSTVPFGVASSSALASGVVVLSRADPRNQVGASIWGSWGGHPGRLISANDQRVSRPSGDRLPGG